MKGGLHVVALTVTDNDGATNVLLRSAWVCNPAGDVLTTVDPQHVHVEASTCVHVSQDHLPG